MFTSANVSNLEGEKNECLIIIFYIGTCVWCFTVYKALSMYTSTPLILKTTLGGRWDPCYLPAICNSPLLSCCFASLGFHTCSSWVLECPLLPPPSILHLVNSQSTLKISATAASFQILWKPPVWCRRFPSVLFLCSTQCSTDHMLL